MSSQLSNITDNGIKSIDIVKKGLARRYRAERRFRRMGLAAIIASLLFLAMVILRYFKHILKSMFFSIPGR